MKYIWIFEISSPWSSRKIFEQRSSSVRVNYRRNYALLSFWGNGEREFDNVELDDRDGVQFYLTAGTSIIWLSLREIRAILVESNLSHGNRWFGIDMYFIICVRISIEILIRSFAFFAETRWAQLYERNLSGAWVYYKA